jgi:hypothetical protein
MLVFAGQKPSTTPEPPLAEPGNVLPQGHRTMFVSPYDPDGCGW